VVIFPRSEKWRGSSASESYRIDHEEWVKLSYVGYFITALNAHEVQPALWPASDYH
jgi:hypothetical protein